MVVARHVPDDRRVVLFRHGPSDRHVVAVLHGRGDLKIPGGPEEFRWYHDHDEVERFLQRRQTRLDHRLRKRLPRILGDRRPNEEPPQIVQMRTPRGLDLDHVVHVDRVGVRRGRLHLLPVVLHDPVTQQHPQYDCWKPQVRCELGAGH